jgi:hypothetical protein
MLSRLSSGLQPITLSVVTGIALAVAGCGSSPSSGTGTSTVSTSAVSSATTGATTTAPPSPRAVVRSASDEVKQLLALAKPGTTIGSQGSVPGWAPANGSAIPAEPSHVSGFGFVADKAIQYLAFAVKDTSGKCAGGDLLANASGTRITGGKAIAVPAKAPCTGDEVAKLAGHIG